MAADAAPYCQTLRTRPTSHRISAVGLRRIRTSTVRTAALVPASGSFIPSPTVSAFHLGPLTIHFYALCILAGIVLAIWLGSKRWRARGGQPGQVLDLCLWAVPLGIIGGRIYHVITDPELYFTPGPLLRLLRPGPRTPPAGLHCLRDHTSSNRPGPSPISPNAVSTGRGQYKCRRR